MLLASFLYNLCLIILYLFLGQACFYAYLNHNKPILLHLSWLQTIFFLDTTVLYIIEFVSSAQQNTAIHHPIFRLLISTVMIGCYGYLLADIMNRSCRPRDFFPAGLLFIASVIILLLPETTHTVLAFYGIRFISMLLLLVLFVWEYRREIAPAMQQSLRFYFPYLWLMFSTMPCSLLEYAVVVYAVNPTLTAINKTFFNERSLVEDLYSILFCMMIAWVFRKDLFDRRRSPEAVPPMVSAAVPQPAATIPSAAAGELAPPADITQFAIHQFSKKYGLTFRETEVLEQMYQHYSTDEISQRLYISVGTVKTHIHNIYQKTGVSKKNELLRLLSEYAQHS